MFRQHKFKWHVSNRLIVIVMFDRWKQIKINKQNYMRLIFKNIKREYFNKLYSQFLA